ncbi:MAG: peptidoglycan editing factor PgeF, partial [Pseudomonadota bacterium]
MPDKTPVPLRSSLLEGRHVRHGFFTRQGGVSKGQYTSLNVGQGSGDDPKAVSENLRRTRAALGTARLILPYQTHSTDVMSFSPADLDVPTRPRADALVTTRTDLFVGVVTADCTPVLLVDIEVPIVGAVHAGWRGATGGILENAVASMVAKGARRDKILAAVGPTIALQSYEVGRDMYELALSLDQGAEPYFFSGTRPAHFQFDLPGYVGFCLSRSGVETVDRLGEDTYSQAERFFSFRRSTHEGASDYGSQPVYPQVQLPKVDG